MLLRGNCASALLSTLQVPLQQTTTTETCINVGKSVKLPFKMSKVITRKSAAAGAGTCFSPVQIHSICWHQMLVPIF